MSVAYEPKLTFLHISPEDAFSIERETLVNFPLWPLLPGLHRYINWYFITPLTGEVFAVECLLFCRYYAL